MSETTVARLTYRSPIEELAKEAAGNWRRFESFAYFGKADDADNRTVVYFENRDSDILTRCNAIIYREELTPFTEGDNPDVIFESHSHWAVGHVDGASIRVYGQDGAITAAFRVYCDLKAQEEQYPALDESRWSDMEYQESIEAWDEYGRDDFRRALLETLDDESQEKWDSLADENAALDRLRERVRDIVSEEYTFDNSGCCFFVDGMAEAVADLPDAEFWRVANGENNTPLTPPLPFPG